MHNKCKIDIDNIHIEQKLSVKERKVFYDEKSQFQE